MARSKIRPESSSESSPEDVLMVGKKRIPAHRITSIHMFELDQLDEFLETAQKEGREVSQEELDERITETIRTLRPLYPPALSRKFLSKAFSIRDWRAPELQDLKNWVQEARESQERPDPSVITQPEREVLGSWLYLMMTDPRNDYIHAENSMWALWESFWGKDAICALSERTVLVGESAQILYQKVKKLSEGTPPDSMSELELDAVQTQLLEQGEDIPSKWKKESPTWKLNFLMGLGPQTIEELTSRLHALAS